MKYDKPTALLAGFDSHGIYRASILDECSFETDLVPTYTPEQTIEGIQARGLGGQLETREDQLIYGWTTAAALAEQFLGDNPGQIFFGRGRQFRACVEELEKAGF